MTIKDIHVVPAGEGWVVEAAGAGKRGRDGQLRERNSFGNDPRDVKG